MTRLASVLTAALTALPLIALATGAAPRLAHAEPPTGALAQQIMEAGGQLPSGGNRGYVAVPAEAFVSPATDPISPIIFVNRCHGGCSFTKASRSDALTNQTIIGPLPQGTRFNLTEFGWSDDIWNQTLACIREVYQPFGVQVVTDDPGQVAHHEAVLAGHSTEAGYPANQVLGVAPLDSSTCRPQNNVISFSFANDHGPSPLDMCWTVAQESAHAFGLDHEFECSDPMTYIPISACGSQKFFRNLDAKCGTNAPATCICGGTTQNSYKRLLGVHGPGTLPVTAPVVNISAPVANAPNLPKGFSVLVSAIDRRGLNHLELYVNNWKWAELAGTWQKQGPYVLSVPMNVPDGVMDVKVLGCGDTGVCGEDHVTVTRGAACTNAATDCAQGQKCEAGKCFWDPPTLNIGDTCEYAQQCLSLSCATVDGAPICSEDCVSGPNDACPDGFECVAPGLGQHGACGPIAVDPGGCCSAGDQGRSTVPAVLVNLGLGCVLGLVVVRRRRRRGPRD